MISLSTARLAAPTALALAAVVVAASASARPTAQMGPAAKGPSPAKLIAQSKKESGLVFYGNPPTASWKAVTDRFRAAYPWIKVTSYDLENNTIFSKYASEAAQRSRTADILVSSAPNLWVYATRQKYLVDYTPRDISKYPSFVKQYKGVFVVSPDPAINVYNKLLLRGKVPTSLTAIARDRATYGKLAGYTADNLFGYTALWGYVQKKGWSNLRAIGSRLKPQTGVAAQLQLVSQGGAVVAFLTSPTARFTIASNDQFSRILGWTYNRDATPLVPRGIGITRKAASPASAKLFLNFVFSKPGQQILCQSGFTAFRRDYKPRNCSNTLDDVYRKVGRRNVIFVPFSQKFVNDRPGFQARWHRIFD